MASLLYRLGRSAFRRRRQVTIAWVAFVAAMAFGALALGQPTVNSFSVPGTESQQALGVLEEKFPTLSAAGASASTFIPTSQDVGMLFTLTSFVIVIAGGVGTYHGALVGGFLPQSDGDALARRNLAGLVGTFHLQSLTRPTNCRYSS